MNISLLTEFLTGAGAILLFWWFLSSTADNELKKNVPVHVVPVAETGIQKNKEKPEQPLTPAVQQESTTEIPGKAAIISTISKPPFPPAVEQETGGGIPDKTLIRTDATEPPGNSITATEASVRNLTTQKQIFDFDPALNAALDFLPISPAGDGQNHQMPNSKKFFFWSPFSLNSKAEMFANHITSVSGVECGVEKTGVGRYQVHSSLEDESGRDEKSALIKDSGLKF